MCLASGPHVQHIMKTKRKDMQKNNKAYYVSVVVCLTVMQISLKKFIHVHLAESTSHL